MPHKSIGEGLTAAEVNVNIGNNIGVQSRGIKKMRKSPDNRLSMLQLQQNGT
jgi:hypothetical protein